MTEPKMAFWNVKKLVKEFQMSRSSVTRTLEDIGAKRWSGRKGGSRV
jgi:hypothetical protein